MVDVYEFGVKYAELHPVAGLYGIEFRLERKLVFLQPVLYDADRQGRSVYRDVEPAEKIRYPAYVILVSVRQKDSPELVAVFFDV